MVILIDDEDRENEGDFVLPACKATPEAINFMLTVARGYMCLSLTEADCDRLDLIPQAPVNTSVRGTPFTVSIDGHPKHGFTTGVSAFERARTIEIAIDPKSTPDDFVRPGHINPLRSRDGGTLVRIGQTEGSIDLCRMAGLHPSAVIIEIMREDGEMARVPDLENLCDKHNLKMCSVAQIIEYRLQRETLVQRVAPVGGEQIETPAGPFNLIAFRSLVDPLSHIALTVGDVGALDATGRVIESDEPTLVRMHRRNLLGDVFGVGNGSPASRNALYESMRAIQKEGRGAIVYLRPEGVGDTLDQRLLAIHRTGEPVQDTPDFDTATANASKAAGMPLREFGVGGQILRELGLRKLRILSNHPKSFPGLDAYGLEIVEQTPIEPGD